MRLYYLLLVLVGTFAASLTAQTDSSVVQLPLIQVKEHHLSSTQDQVLNSDQEDHGLFPLEHNVIDLIQLFSVGFLRDHGNKTLGTLSVRGSSSQQTKVLWNSADIGNPMLGLSDISMLPTFFFDDISIQSTTADAAYNPIGGALQLNSKLKDSSEYKLGYSGGEFGFHQGYFKGQLNISPKFKIGMRAFLTSDKQNFPYLEEHRSVLLPERQPDALHTQNGLMGNVTYILNKVHSVKASTWLQSLYREIPPLRTQRISEATQLDSIVRGQFIWVSEWDSYQQTTNYTLRKESNVYRDQRNGINNNNAFRAHQLLSKHKLSFNEQFDTKFGFNANWYHARTSNYDENFARISSYRFYLNPIYNFTSTPIQLDFALRYSLDDGKVNPLTGHIKALWKQKNHHVSMAFVRAHRMPSLNDLYWVPAGNPDLKAELSHQWNIGYQHKFISDRFYNKMSVNLFYKKVDNWILWAPLDQFIWSPQNILQVTSLGLDLNQRFVWQIDSDQHLRFQFNVLYQSVQNTSHQNTTLAQQGSQLIYMPKYKLGGSLSWQIFDLTFMYLHQWRSTIYTQANLSEKLPPLSLGQARISYALNIGKHKLQLFIRNHNIWNTSYFYQPGLPAPGTRWRAGILIQKL